ncbi:MAG TPA: type II toxin-antitoxin system VapC family toxin [Solirubrobacterales bacterium]|nr:type II toxin-antitoxin system VapC family toxin [Solirubrobacterales bacterium]
MILDTSAVVAVLREEDGFERLAAAMEGSDVLAIGAPTLFETSMVLVGLHGDEGGRLVARFRDHWNVEVVPFDARHEHAARDAFARYGKGRHPAKLNFGDCMSYATARLAEMPLLFIGDDFAKTDVEAA